MKRFILVILAVVPAALFAQKNTSPSKGAFMVELGCNPFGDKVLTIDGLRLKYVLSDRLNLRLGLNLDVKNDDLQKSGYRPEDTSKPVSLQKTSMFALKPGVEWRLLAESKISPYVGGEFVYGHRSSRGQRVLQTLSSYQGTVETETTTTVSGACLVSEYLPGQGTLTSYANRIYNSYGLNVVAGTDFNLVRNFYFGFELGLGYNYIKYGRVTEKQSVYTASSSTTVTTERTLMPAWKSSSYSLYTDGALRIGVWF